MSPSLSSIIFLNAKSLRMMSEGYAWIVTDKTINLLHYMDSEAIESMQGFKSMQGALAGNQASVPNLSALLNQILKVRFIGLGGEFRLIIGSLLPKEFEIVNVIGKWKRRIRIWTPGDGISRARGSTTTPKRSKMGIISKKLRIGVPVNRGFLDLVNLRLDETNATIVTSFCIDVFSAAIEGLQYEAPYEFIPFFRPNGHSVGSRNDLIDQVKFRLFDVVVGDTTITANRSLYVDFTLPYTDLGVGMVVRIGNKNMRIFLEPLDVDLWMTIVGFLIVIGSIRLASNDFIEYRDNNLLRGAIVRNLNFRDGKLKLYSSPEEYADALTRGSKNGGVGAIIDEIPNIKIFLGKYVPGQLRDDHI
ncbi:hypothetical protein LguiA_020706 [Lonicera macranthoides]